MTRRLVILANAFPYGTWEPFLMTELQYLKGFDEINIMSLSVRPDQERSRRDLPAGPFTVDPIRFRSKAFYFANAWRALGDGRFWGEAGNLLKTGRMNPRNLVTLFVFFSRAHHETSEISRALRSRGASKTDRTTFYSYRLFYQPYMAHLLQKSFPGAASVARAHRADLYEEHSPTKYLPLREFTVSSLDRIWCIADHGRDYLLRMVPSAVRNTVVSRLGTIDHGLCLRAPEPSPLRIVTCSSLSPVKRVHLLVDALSRVEIPVRWDHYGEGELQDSIRARAASALGSNIDYAFHGFVPNDQVVRRYVDDPVHLLVNVSESEGVPVSIMEALSTGTPVLATDVGGTGEIVDDGVNGWLLPPDVTPDSLARRLEMLSSFGAEEWNALRDRARESWEALANADTCYGTFAEELAEAAK